jgi:glutathione S-transferase
MAWLRSALAALRQERPTTTMFYDRASEPLSPAGERDAVELVRVARAVVPADGGALFGAWCLADAELAFMLHRLVLNGHAVPDAVRRFAERQWTRPSVRAFVEHARPTEVPEGYWRHSGLVPPRRTAPVGFR